MFRSLGSNRAVTAVDNFMLIYMASRGKGVYKQEGGYHRTRVKNTSGSRRRLCGVRTPEKSRVWFYVEKLESAQASVLVYNGSSNLLISSKCKAPPVGALLLVFESTFELPAFIRHQWVMRGTKASVALPRAVLSDIGTTRL